MPDIIAVFLFGRESVAYTYGMSDAHTHHAIYGDTIQNAFGDFDARLARSRRVDDWSRAVRRRVR